MKREMERGSCGCSYGSHQTTYSDGVPIKSQTIMDVPFRWHGSDGTCGSDGRMAADLHLLFAAP
jgi:hypothetical protein